MTKKFYLPITTALLIAVFGICANAQSRTRQQIRVNIPFAFSVGNSTLPAGDYRVNVVNPASDQIVLQIASLDGKSTSMIHTTDISGWASSKAKLSFHHYGEQYFLAQVWMAGDSTGLAMPSSNAEKTLRRQLGKAAKNVEMIAVNAQ
jgi:hypothetical protein